MLANLHLNKYQRHFVNPMILNKAGFKWGVQICVAEFKDYVRLIVDRLLEILYNN